jgi:CHAD domain-containing protein
MAKQHARFPSQKAKTLNKFSGLGVKFKTQLGNLQKNAGNEAALYQLRVCLKRTLSLTEFLSNAPIDNLNTRRHNKKFKILQKKISKIRDLQVQAKLIQKYRKPSGKAESIFFQWLNLNKVRKTRELEITLKKEKSANYLALYKEISESLNTDNREILLYTNTYINDQLILGEIYCQHVRRDFHKLRVIVKKLHFTMDLHGKLSDSILYRMKQVEKLLGNAHDLTLGRAIIKQFLIRHKVSQASEKAIRKMSSAMLKKISADLKRVDPKAINLLNEIKEINNVYTNKSS